MAHREGDFVRVKTYDEMKEKYGTDKMGDIIPQDGTGYVYAEEMAQYGGKEYRIESTVGDVGYILEGEEYIGQYTFTDAMLEAVE